MNKIAVYGIYPSQQHIESAVNQLKLAGFRNSDVSVLFADKDNSKKFAHENSTKAPEGATTGAVAGASAGGVLGWFAGIGALAIPGAGPLIAAGPIMAMLAGVATGGALGGLAGGLIGYGIPEYEAKRYEGLINDGGILLSVHVDNSDWQDKAKNILEKTGAEDIGTKDQVSCDSDSETSCSDQKNTKRLVVNNL